MREFCSGAYTDLERHPDKLMLFGVGLGEATGHVADYYRNSIADIPVDRLGEEIARLLLRVCHDPRGS